MSKIDISRAIRFAYLEAKDYLFYNELKDFIISGFRFGLLSDYLKDAPKSDGLENFIRFLGSIILFILSTFLAIFSFLYIICFLLAVIILIIIAIYREIILRLGF